MNQNQNHHLTILTLELNSMDENTASSEAASIIYCFHIIQIDNPNNLILDAGKEEENIEKSKLEQLYTEFYQQLVEAVSDLDTCHSLTTQLLSTSLLSEEKKAVLSSSVTCGRSFLKVLGVEEEPHLVTVLIDKMSAVKELQTLSEDMSDWLNGSKQGT